MKFDQMVLATLVAATCGVATNVTNCPPFPSSATPFSAGFQQPDPPLLQTKFQANFVQHKWNLNLSHITVGYITNSPSEGFVRAEEAFDGNAASSLFNYANVTKDGLVDNTLTTYSPNSTKPDIWRGYVDSDFPLFANDLLVQGGAVFGNLVNRPFLQEKVAAWDIMYQGAIPVTIYVDRCNFVVGYDYFSPGLRTRVITDFFNIQVGA